MDRRTVPLDSRERASPQSLPQFRVLIKPLHSSRERLGIIRWSRQDLRTIRPADFFLKQRRHDLRQAIGRRFMDLERYPARKPRRRDEYPVPVEQFPRIPTGPTISTRLFVEKPSYPHPAPHNRRS